MQKLTEMRQVVSLCPSYNHKQINHEAGDVRLQNPCKKSRFELLEGILRLQKRGLFFFFFFVEFTEGRYFNHSQLRLLPLFIPAFVLFHILLPFLLGDWE